MSIFKNYTYIFYDLETTGQNPCFDQVIRFAAKETDHNLNIINDLRINFGLIALSDIDKQWQRKLSIASFGEASDRIIGELTEYEEVPTQKSDETLRNHLENTLNKIGRAAQLG